MVVWLGQDYPPAQPLSFASSRVYTALLGADADGLEDATQMTGQRPQEARPMSRQYSERPETHPDSNEEQRRSRRVVLGADVSVLGDTGGVPQRGRLINLSVDGAFVLTSDLHPVGTVLRVKMSFAGNTEVSSTVRVRSRLPGRGNGVAFLSLAPEHRSSIETLVQRGHPDTVSPLSGIRSVYS